MFSVMDCYHETAMRLLFIADSFKLLLSMSTSCCCYRCIPIQNAPSIAYGNRSILHAKSQSTAQLLMHCTSSLALDLCIWCSHCVNSLWMLHTWWVADSCERDDFHWVLRPQERVQWRKTYWQQHKTRNYKPRWKNNSILKDYNKIVSRPNNEQNHEKKPEYFWMRMSHWLWIICIT